MYAHTEGNEATKQQDKENNPNLERKRRARPRAGAWGSDVRTALIGILVIVLQAPARADEVISRAWTVHNRYMAEPTFAEAISRADTIHNDYIAEPTITEAISRADTVRNNYTPEPVIIEAISSGVTECNVGVFADEDGDTVHDCNDICPGGDDTVDADADTDPNECDLCPNDPSPVIVQQPMDIGVCEGVPTMLSASATGGTGGAVSYQWRKGNSDLLGETGSTLAFADPVAADSGTYRVRITNACGTRISLPAVLTVAPDDLDFATQPMPLTVSICETAVFTADATSTLPLTVRWQLDGQPLDDGPTAHDSVISGATTETLQISNVGVQDEGMYELVAEGSCNNSLVSDPAELIVDTIGATPAWEALAGGVGSAVSTVYTMIVHNGELVVGGTFKTSNGAPANYIARWNGSAWMPLGAGGPNGHVTALAVYNGELIAGGNSYAGIRRWNGSSWSTLGTGLNGPYFALLALTVFNNELIAGGQFTTAGGSSAQNVARWNGTSWAPLGMGTSGPVHSLAVHDSKLIVGGYFLRAGGQLVNNVARWDGSVWSPLGSGFSSTLSGAPSPALALAVHNGELIAGGGFTYSGGQPVRAVALWNGSTWVQKGNLSYGVYAIRSFDGDLFAGGEFGSPKNYMARWNGTDWEPLNGGTNNVVYALVDYNAELIMGGTFTAAGGVYGLNKIARLTYIANDDDGDGICDSEDNCVTVANVDQADDDEDGIGDVCDLCPGDDQADVDEDEVPDGCDNCPAVHNPGTYAIIGAAGRWQQPDSDEDGVGDSCDNCPELANSDQADADLDEIGDACEPFVDTDGDGIEDEIDVQPSVPSTLYSYTVAGHPTLSGEVILQGGGATIRVRGELRACGMGPNFCPYIVSEVTDVETAAGVAGITPPPKLKSNSMTRAITLFNGLFSLGGTPNSIQSFGGQAEIEYDFAGGETHLIQVSDEAAAIIHENVQSDEPIGVLLRAFNSIVTADGAIVAPGQFFEMGVAPTVDSDGDTVLDVQDNCILSASLDQSDGDLDLIGNACDNCAGIFNQFHYDIDGDGIGDVCDACPLDSANDTDNDGRCALFDNCPTVNNPLQEDTDQDGIGDACDPPDIIWDSDPISPDRTTRSLRFSVQPPVTATGTPEQSAIKVTLVDLQTPNPANNPSFPPPQFGCWEAGGSCGTVIPAVVGPPAVAACTGTGETNGCARWVGKPSTFYESQGPPLTGPYRAARLQCEPVYWDWVTETAIVPITVVGAEILPSSEYSVQTYASSCKGVETGCANVSAAVTMYTRRSGDVDAEYNPPSATNQPNAIDVAQVVNKFKNAAGSPDHYRAQIQPNLPELNASVNALDIVAVVDATKSFAYSFSGPCPCPSTVTCGGSCTGCPGMCVKTCTGGDNDGEPCINNNHCPSGACAATGTCRDNCGRCTP